MQILFEDPHLVALSKPFDVSFHSEDGIGFFEQAKQYLGYDVLFPVHRLDKMTSGVIVFAKTKIAAQALGNAFEQHDVEKYYVALSDKKPKKKQGCIKGDMVKTRGGSYKLTTSTNNPAVTQFFSYTIGEGKRVYILKPHTGKTHQLRVMMKSIGAPILGDSRYQGSDADRGYLHAYQIQFRLFENDYVIQDDQIKTTWPLTELDSTALSPHTLLWPTLKVKKATN